MKQTPAKAPDLGTLQRNYESANEAVLRTSASLAKAQSASLSAKAVLQTATSALNEGFTALKSLHT